MKGFIDEFKKFILRGNVMDMAVGIVVGAAFTSIVNSLVNDIIMPLISLLFGGISFESWNVLLKDGDPGISLNFGTFVAAILNFIIVAFVIFCVIKGINTMRDKVSKKTEEEPAAPTTKTCPYCLSEVPIGATKCCHCTSELPAEEAAE